MAEATTVTAPAPMSDAGLMSTPAETVKPSVASVLFDAPKAAPDAAAAPAPAEAPTVPTTDGAPAAVEPPKDAAAAPDDGKSLIGEEAKPENAEVKPTSPIEYKFELPTDANLDPARLDAFKSLVSSLNDGKGLSNEDANKLLALGLEDGKAANKAINDQWEATRREWREQVKADPDVGGDKLQKEVLPAINKMLVEFTRTPAALKELRQQFDATGLGDNPVVIRTLYKMASALTEGKLVTAGGPVQGKRSAAEVLFPSSTN